jgi:hypothetical protein
MSDVSIVASWRNPNGGIAVQAYDGSTMVLRPKDVTAPIATIADIMDKTVVLIQSTNLAKKNVCTSINHTFYAIGYSEIATLC